MQGDMCSCLSKSFLSFYKFCLKRSRRKGELEQGKASLSQKGIDDSRFILGENKRMNYRFWPNYPISPISPNRHGSIVKVTSSLSCTHWMATVPQPSTLPRGNTNCPAIFRPLFLPILNEREKNLKNSLSFSIYSLVPKRAFGSFYSFPYISCLLFLRGTF